MSGRWFIPAVLGTMVASFAPALAQANGAPSSAPFGPPVGDQQIYAHLILNQFEGRFGAKNIFRWSGEAWAGTDTNRLWIRSEGNTNAHGGIEDSQQEVFYDRPITPYFDLQAGLRSDFDSKTGRTWAAFGVQGLAPYFFEVSATAYMSDSGHYAAKFEGSTDWLLTQRLILQPQIEMNFYTRDDPGRAIGAGLSDLDTGLRLRYEITRKFAPYVALTYSSMFGGTADFARGAGEKTNALSFVVGVRAWL